MTEAYFPFEYVVGMLDHLQADPRVCFCRYDDFPFYDDLDYEDAYPDERKRWIAQRDPAKIHVILQYDVDKYPERTGMLLLEHLARALPCNVQVLVNRVDEDADEYHAHLTRIGPLVNAGLVCLGYHCNTYERSCFNLNVAQQLFAADVAELEERYCTRIEFWSPHGGNRDAVGQSNAHVLKTPEHLRHIRWIQNGNTLRLNGQYSDGGISNPGYNTMDRDLRKFVREMKVGERYRILLHPQYYAYEYEECEQIAGLSWYQEVLEREGMVWD